MPAESRRVPGHCPLRNHPGLSNAGHGSSRGSPTERGLPWPGSASPGRRQQVWGGSRFWGLRCPWLLLPSCRDPFGFDTGSGIAPWWNSVGSSQCCGKGSVPAPSLRGGGLQLGTCCRALRGRCTTSSGCQKNRDLIVLTIRWHRRLRLPAGSPSVPGARVGLYLLSHLSWPGRDAAGDGAASRLRRMGWGTLLAPRALRRAEGDPGATLPGSAIPAGGREGPWEPCPRAVPVSAPTAAACH